MPPEKIKYTIDLAKVMVGLGAIGSFLFYAGRVDEHVSALEVRTTRIENYVYPPNLNQINQARADYNKSVKVK